MNFILTHSQKRGLSLLLTLVFLILVWNTFQYFRLRNLLNVTIHSLSVEKPKVVLVPLNINLADSIELESLPGIGPKLASRIVKYREKAGGFSSVEQVSKMYGLTPENFEKAKPWLFVAEGFHPEKVNYKRDCVYQKRNAFFQAKELIDINETDSLGLTEIRGVGAFLAGKIVKYRTMLGYYYSINQLSEVRGMHADNLDKIKAQVKVGSDFSSYPHLKVNVQTGYELSAHPYLSYKEGKLLEAYRNQHGPYADSLSFTAIKEFPDSTLRKIMPYVDFSK